MLCGCADHRPTSNPGDIDPFIGFFADPNVGILDLHEDNGTYRGTFTSNSRSYSVKATRHRDVLEGSVDVNGRPHDLEIDNTFMGLYITIDGTRGQAALQNFATLQTYQRWVGTQTVAQPLIVNDERQTSVGR